MKLEKVSLVSKSIKGLSVKQGDALSVNEISLRNNVLGYNTGSFRKDLNTRLVNYIGSETPVAGNNELGFFGEVSASEFIDGPTLASTIELDYGSDINVGEPWLKFKHQGRRLYVAKKNLRKSVTWFQIAKETTITIKGRSYICRLLWDSTDYKEWDDLIYKVHVNNPGTEQWASYSSVNLEIAGRYSATATYVYPNTGRYRGFDSLEQSDISSSPNGWRPVLELIQ